MGVNYDPVITEVIYNGSEITVSWNPSADAGVTGYVIQLTYIGEKTGEIAYQSVLFEGQAKKFGKLALPGCLNTDVTYLVTVQAMWGNELGETSEAVTLLTVLPVFQGAWYDGTDIHFEWLPSPQAAQGYQLIVYSTDSGLFYSYSVADPSAWKGVLPGSVMTQGFDPGQQWVATVAAVGENNVTARSPIASFPKPRPVLQPNSSILYQLGRGINASWTPLAGANITGYRLKLTSPQDDTDIWIDVPNAQTQHGILPILAPLAADQAYEFRLIALTSSKASVASSPLKVITTLPVLLSVSYDTVSVTMTWGGLANFLITGYTLQVLSLSSGNSYTQDVPGYFSTQGVVQIPTGGLAVDQQWVARVTANGPVSGQAFEAPIQVSSPWINTVQCDAGMVTVEWGALTDAPDEYVATLFLGDKPVANAVAKGSSATLAIPKGTLPITVQVMAKRGIATGPASAATAVISASPQNINLQTNPVTGASRLAWGGIDTATAYSLSFSNGGKASSSTSQYDLPTPPSANADIAVTVSALLDITGAGGKTTAIIGPSSHSFTLPTGQPQLVGVEFDGIDITVQWQAVPQAAGYRVSVQQTGAEAAEVAYFNTDGPAVSAVFPFTPPDASQFYVVGVQGRFADLDSTSIGPLSQTLPIFQAGFFISTVTAATAYPYVYPATGLATVLSATPAETITLYLPQIGGAIPLKDLPIIQGPFNLQANTDTASQTAYPYLLSLAADSDAWHFSTEPIRTDLQASYIAFLKDAEQKAGVVPWGIGLLQQAISRYMPQTFQELLYYAYGLTFPGENVGTAYTDLRPGMVLRVAVDTYQALTESSNLRWSTGYTGGSVLEYDIGGFTDTAGNWNVGYDSFIGQLVAGGALTVTPPPFNAPTQQEGGVADAADLYFPGFRMPFYRLFVPTTLATPNTACPTDTPKSFVLAAAPTYAALTISGNTPGGACPVAYFRGRAVIRACIRIRLDGNELVVPVGTTVANVLERAGRLTSPAPVQLQGLVVARALGPVVLDPTVPASCASSYNVYFDWKTQPLYAPGWNALSMPLLPGDSISTHP